MAFVRKNARSTTGIVVSAAVLLGMCLEWPVGAVQSAPQTAAPSTRPCRVQGTIKSGSDPLPGVTLVVKTGETSVGSTSSDLDGSFVIALAPGTYSLHVELTAFATADRTVTLGPAPCSATVDVELALAPRPANSSSSTATASSGTQAPAATAREGGAAGPGAAGRAGGGQAAANGRGGGRFGGGPPRFQALTVSQSDQTAQAGQNVVAAGSADVVDLSAGVRADDPAAQLLPPGFSADAGGEDAVAVSGTLIQTDRGQLADRITALNGGQFGLTDGQQFGPGGAAGTPSLAAQLGGVGGAGGRGGGPGGPGGGFAFGGRVGGANRLQVNTSYQLGGSIFNAQPYALNPASPPAKPTYLDQSVSTTLGGGLKIPHVYDGTNRTTWNLSVTGTRDGNLFDQLATVPTDALRSGDFSGLGVTVIDPTTGQPFPNDQIPANRISPVAAGYLAFIPEPNVPGAAAIQNYHYTTTSQANTNQFTLRITHSLTAPQAGGRGGGRGGAGAGRWSGRRRWRCRWWRSCRWSSGRRTRTRGSGSASTQHHAQRQRDVSSQRRRAAQRVLAPERHNGRVEPQRPDHRRDALRPIDATASISKLQSHGLEYAGPLCLQGRRRRRRWHRRRRDGSVRLGRPEPVVRVADGATGHRAGLHRD